MSRMEETARGKKAQQTKRSQRGSRRVMEEKMRRLFGFMDGQEYTSGTRSFRRTRH